MLENFGLSEQAQLKKDFQLRAEALGNKPFVIVETFKRTVDEMTARITDIEGVSDLLSAFQQDYRLDPEGRNHVLTKTNQPQKMKPDLFFSPDQRREV